MYRTMMKHIKNILKNLGQKRTRRLSLAKVIQTLKEFFENLSLLLSRTHVLGP